MSQLDFMVTSNALIEIRKFNCPSCEKVVYELNDHEVEACVHCGEEFHGEIEADYEPDKYYLVLKPKTGVPFIHKIDEA